MGISYQTKRKLSLLSGLMIHSEFGAMYTLGTITPYIASYLKYNGNPNIQVVDVGINYPIMMVCITTALILSTYLFLYPGIWSKIMSNQKLFALSELRCMHLEYLLLLGWGVWRLLLSFLVHSAL